MSAFGSIRINRQWRVCFEWHDGDVRGVEIIDDHGRYRDSPFRARRHQHRVLAQHAERRCRHDSHRKDSSPALLFAERRFAQTHKGARMLFNKHFVKPSRFSAGAAQFFNELFETRMESDYAIFLDVDGDKVQAWLPRAEGFVDEAATLIE